MQCELNAKDVQNKTRWIVKCYPTGFCFMLLTYSRYVNLSVQVACIRFMPRTSLMAYAVTKRRRRLLSTTLTLEKAMSALAQRGVICQSMPNA